MYLGQIVESGPADRVLRQPEHPYTASLIASVPRVRHGPSPADEGKRHFQVRSDPPDPWAPSPGCSFSSRCPFAMDRCRTDDPPVVNLPGQVTSRCHLPAATSDDATSVEQIHAWSSARKEAGINGTDRHDDALPSRKSTEGR